MRSLQHLFNVIPNSGDFNTHGGIRHPFGDAFAIDHCGNHLVVERKLTQNRYVHLIAPVNDLLGHFEVEVTFVDDHPVFNAKIGGEFDNTFEVMKPRTTGFGDNHGKFSASDRRNDRTSCTGRAIDDDCVAIVLLSDQSSLIANHTHEFTRIFFSGSQSGMNHNAVSIVSNKPSAFIVWHHGNCLGRTKMRTEFTTIAVILGDGINTVDAMNGIKATEFGTHTTLGTFIRINHGLKASDKVLVMKVLWLENEV